VAWKKNDCDAPREANNADRAVDLQSLLSVAMRSLSDDKRPKKFLIKGRGRADWELNSQVVRTQRFHRSEYRAAFAARSKRTVCRWSTRSPVRVALTGGTVSPAYTDVIAVLGKSGRPDACKRHWNHPAT